MTSIDDQYKAEIEAIMAEFYGNVSGPRGEEPRMNDDSRIFHADALLGRTSYREGDPPEPYLRMMTLAEHSDQARPVLVNMDFWEVETGRECFFYRNIAQVISHYDAYGDPGGKTLIKRGVNLLL
ncbi:MAG: hypothetical protein V3R73_02425, partial [Sphingomonadales bacterium]